MSASADQASPAVDGIIPPSDAFDLPLAPPEVASPSSTEERPSNSPLAALWVIFGFAGGQVLRLASNIVLARLLAPESFGLMTIVTSLLIGLEMFSDIGIGFSVIQNKRGADPDFLDTAWTMQVLRGWLICAVISLIAWPVSHFYEQPELKWLIVASGVTSVFGGFCSTSLYTARRSLQLKRLYLFEFSTQLLGAVVSCVWACFSPTVWALIVGTLAASCVRAIFSHLVFEGHKNRFSWRSETVAQVVDFGKWVFICSMITFLAMTSDRLVLGKLVEKSALGLYGQAVNLATLPQMLLTSLAVSWLFPTLSRHARSSTAAVAGILHPIRDTLLAVGVVLVLGVFVESDLLYRLLYKQSYQSVPDLIHLICVSTWLTLLSGTLEPALFAIGDSRSGAMASALRFLANTACSLLGFYYYGMTGFIVGLWVGALCGQAVVTWRAWRHQIFPTRQDLNTVRCSR